MHLDYTFRPFAFIIMTLSRRVASVVVANGEAHTNNNTREKKNTGTVQTKEDTFC